MDMTGLFVHSTSLEVNLERELFHTISGRLRDKVIERLIDVQDNQSEVGKLVLQILRGDIELVIE